MSTIETLLLSHDTFAFKLTLRDDNLFSVKLIISTSDAVAYISNWRQLNLVKCLDPEPPFLCFQKIVPDTWVLTVVAGRKQILRLLGVVNHDNFLVLVDPFSPLMARARAVPGGWALSVGYHELSHPQIISPLPPPPLTPNQPNRRSFLHSDGSSNEGNTPQQFPIISEFSRVSSLPIVNDLHISTREIEQGSTPPESEFTETIRLSKQEVRFLIGPKGRRIQHIHDVTGCRITISPLSYNAHRFRVKGAPQIISLQGTSAQVGSARYMLRKVLSDFAS